LHYHPAHNLEWLLQEHDPDVVVLGPPPKQWPDTLRGRLSIAANGDFSAEGVPSVCLDEARISSLAFRHLASRGLKHVTTFSVDDSLFARLREQAFREEAARAGTTVVPGWARSVEERAGIEAWLKNLPKPCGVYVCCDVWGRMVAQYARSARLRVPEDLALVGVDNDMLECELITPPLSSVAIPWRTMGESVAELVHQGLAGRPIAGQRVVIEPIDVVSRRSSDALAIDNAMVRSAVAWIREHADRRISVPAVAAAVRTPRQRLERLFRTHLGRTIMQEVRRAHVEAGKALLATTDLTLPEIASRSGFTNSALLNQAFHREVGLPPGEYRRRVGALIEDDD
jgi:LacI family transcriptional regulator